MGKISLEVISDKDSAIWDSLLSRTSDSTIYHSYDWLHIMRKYNHSKLILFALRKGEDYLGLFPIFYRKRFLIHTFFSPPQSLAVPQLGPVFFNNSSKQSDRENSSNKFIDLILDYLANTLKIRSFYSQFQTTASIEDVRPFIWKGFTAHPLYTYIIPIQDNLEEIKKGFSQSERRYLNRAINDKDIAIEIGTEEDLVRVNNAVKKRYESQGIKYSVPDDYLREVYKYFKEEIFIVKLTHKGEFMSGMIYVKNNNTLSFWIGGTPPIKKLPGSISLLHWWGIEQAAKLGMNKYEVMGANTEHLSTYKSKLNPELSIYFSITKKNLSGRFAEFFYKRLRKKSHI